VFWVVTHKGKPYVRLEWIGKGQITLKASAPIRGHWVRELRKRLTCFHPIRGILTLTGREASDAYIFDCWLSQWIQEQRREGFYFELGDTDVDWSKVLTDDAPPGAVY